MEGLSPEERSNQAAGHKANISNPNTSEASKQKSREALKALGGEDAFYSQEKQGDDGAAVGLGEDGNVLGGHKATLSNPNASADAKDHSAQVLKEAGAK